MLLLSLLGISVAAAVAGLQYAPGYMDADYYMAIGLRLAGGEGFSEPFLWNYLDNPVRLPHPSNAYWMPMASLLAAIGPALTGARGEAAFPIARLPFLLLAASMPTLTAAIAHSLTNKRRHAILAGLLAAFPAFYLPFLTTTDTFGIYMLLGSLWLLVAGWKGKGSDSDLLPSNFQPILLGVIAGLMHLARADGILWLAISFIAMAMISWSEKCMMARESWSLGRLVLRVIGALLRCLLGYLLVMGPWMLRNLAAFGTPLAPGGGRALWVRSYNELFSYPAEILNIERWWSGGLEKIVQARVWALGQNLQSGLAVQGIIFLAPLILMGLWQLRRERRVRLGVIAWLVTFGVMTMIFPFAGARGGFFHSGTALQPLLWACAPVGLEAFLEWGARWRGWRVQEARRFFSAGLVALAMLLTILIVRSRVIGPGPDSPLWGREVARYKRLEMAIQALGARSDEPALVNNPPGFWLASGRPALYTPNGDEVTLLSVARRYGGQWLLLEPDHSEGLESLYETPENQVGLRYLGTVEAVRVFEIVGDW